MKKSLHNSLLMLMFFGILSISAFSQAYHVYKIDPSGFPTIKASFLAKTQLGADVPASELVFSLTENGVNYPITVNCDKKPDTPGVSIVFVLECTSSMNDEKPDGKESKLTWLKAALDKFADSLYFANGTKVAIVKFGGESSVHTNFVTTRDDLHKNVSGANPILAVTGPADFNKAFNGPSAYPFTMLAENNPDLFRHIIFVTDGEPGRPFIQTDANKVITSAKGAKIIIHAVSIVSDMNEYVESFSKGTGGMQFEPSTKADLISNLEYLAGYIQKREYCQLSWTAPYGCDAASKNRIVNIKATRNSVSVLDDTRSYVAPEKSVVKLTMTPTKLIFGSVAGGDTEKTITVSQTGPDVTIIGLQFEVAGGSENDITVSSWGGSEPPFKLKDGQTRSIKLKFDKALPITSKKIEVTLLSSDAPCTPLPTITCITGCGGEALETFEFPGVSVGSQSVNQDINCAFKNTTVESITVKAELKGENKEDFILTGTGEKTLSAGECINISGKFIPTGSTTNIRKAYIEFTINNSECGGPYSTQLSGEALPNSVDENKILDNSSVLSMTAKPNPAINDIKISYNTTSNGKVSLDLINSYGVLIEKIIDKDLPYGKYDTNLQISNLAAGVYFLKLQNGNQNYIQKIVVIK